MHSSDNSHLQPYLASHLRDVKCTGNQEIYYMSPITDFHTNVLSLFLHLCLSACAYLRLCECERGIDFIFSLYFVSSFVMSMCVCAFV